MRRTLSTALVALILLTGGARGLPEQSASIRLPHLRAVVEQKANRGPCDEERFVSIKPSLGHDKIVRRVKGLIRCAVRRFDVDGGVSKALEVADCESSFWPWAHSGSNRGVFQQNIGPDGSWWEQRARKYLKRAWFPQHFADVVDHGWYKARANILMSIRMAHQAGWGSWSCA
jgi:hypothetical protein